MSENAENARSNPESTSTTLIEKLKSGDEDTWSYFLFAYRPLIQTWALQTGASKSDAADVAQEVVSNVVRGIEDFQKGERTGSFRKWLKTITRRRTIDLIRKRQRAVDAEGGTAAHVKINQIADPIIADETQSDVDDDRSVLLKRTLAYLKSKVKPHTYEAFHRVVVDGQDPQQVAKDLNISADVVYQASSRMLARLRKALGEELDVPG